MPVIKNKSLRDILYLQDRMNKMFDESMKSVSENHGLGEWIPYADIFEDDKAIVIKTELPGIQREDVMIDINPTTLTITGKKARPYDGRIESYHSIERQYGSFKRAFAIPPGVNAEKITAKLDIGVLEIRLPKEKECVSKKIAITPG